MARQKPSAPSRPLWPFVILGAAALLVVIVRVRLAGVPLERDEGEYAYVGRWMLHGVAPYASAYSMKLPGAYAMYAVVMAVAGSTATAIRLGLLAVNLATMALIALLGRRVADASTGAIAGAAYGLASLSVSVMGFAAHATHFVVLFAAAGLILLCRALETGGTATLVASGALLGTAFLMKQHGIVFALFGVVWLIKGGRRSPRQLGAFTLGVAAPVAAVVVALAAAGVLGTFWFWNVLYAADYATGSTLSEGIDNLVYQLRLMHPLTGFAVLAGIGLLWRTSDEPARRAVPFLGWLLLFSAAAVTPGLYFRDHYFIQMLPAVALLVGLAVTAAARRLGHGAAIAGFLAAAAWLVGNEGTLYFPTSPTAFCRKVYGSNPFPEALEIAAHVKGLTRPGDRVAILGSEPEIYFLADRRAATGHIYMYGLMEDQPHNLAMQKELESEIEAAAPPVIVLVNVSLSWIRRPGSPDHIFTWAESYLAAHYEQVGSVEVLDPESRSVWSGAAAAEVPPSENYLLVYRRKG